MKITERRILTFKKGDIITKENLELVKVLFKAYFWEEKENQYFVRFDFEIEIVVREYCYV